MNVSQSSEHLIRVNFSQSIRKLIIFFIIKSQNFIQSVRHVIHHQVQKNILRAFFLSKEKMMHFYTVWVVQFDHDLKFSVRVLWVLVYFFNCDFFFVFFSLTLINNSKSSLPNHFHPVILRRIVFLVGNFFFF